MPQNSRSKDFRHIYANTFTLSFSSTEVQIVCGIMDRASTEEGVMEEEVDIILNLSSAKLLASLLSTLIDGYETDVATIPIDESKVAEVKSTIEARRRATKLKA